MKTMAVAVFPGKKEIRLIEKDPPEINGPKDVKIRMLDVGICGTDREICRFEYGTPPRGSEHLVIGHESLGEVLETGNEVNLLEPGDLVVPMVRRPCPHEHCLACRNGRQDHCYTDDFVERGIKESHGYMTGFVVDHERYIVPVPRELREIAVLVEPLTIAQKALAQVREIQQRLPWKCRHSHSTLVPDQGHRQNAVVLGAGPVGLLGAMALRAAGFKTYVYSRSPAPNSKSDIVKVIGAEYISSEMVPTRELLERVGNIDLIYEAVGASRISFEVMKVLGLNGIFIFTGVPGRKGPIELDTDLIMRNLVLKNQVVLGTVNAGRDAYESAIHDLENFQKLWPDAVSALITSRNPPQDYRKLLLDKPEGIKNVIVIM